MLWGRRQQCRALDGLLAEVRTGRSRVLGVRGEPGIGKTAVLGYAADTAPDFQVARAEGVELMALAEDPQVCSAEFPTWLTLRVSGRLLFVACFAGVSRRRGDGGRGGRDEPGDDGDGLAAVRAGGDCGDGGVVVSARVVVLLAALAAVLRATRVVAMRVVGLASAAALAAGAVPPALAAGGGAEPLAGCGGGPGEFGAAGGAGSLFGAGHRVPPAVVALRMVSARCWWARMR